MNIKDWPESEKNTALDYLRWNSYTSKEHKLFYVATPKVACTSLKWWFAALEGKTQAIQGVTGSEESDPTLDIHQTFHRAAPDVTGLNPEAIAEALESDSYFRFSVVRNPYKRIFSAWQSKILLREPLQVAQYLKHDFLNHPIEDLTDVAGAFEFFLEHLRKNEAPSYWDPHWTPQYRLPRPDLINYSKLGRIEEPDELSEALSNWLGPQIPNPFENHHANESMIPYMSELVTRRSSEILYSLYAEDFESFGYESLPPKTKTSFSDDQFHVALKAIQLIRGRHQRLGERSVRIRELIQIAGENERQIADLAQIISDRGTQIYNPRKKSAKLLSSASRRIAAPLRSIISRLRLFWRN